MQNWQSPVVWISLSKVFWSFVQIFFFCYYGEQLTNGFFELKRAIYECDWYRLPLEMQKMIPIIGINIQQPVYLEGLAHTYCTLETFKGVRFFDVISQMNYLLNSIVFGSYFRLLTVVSHISCYFVKLSNEVPAKLTIYEHRECIHFKHCMYYSLSLYFHFFHVFECHL